MKTICIMRDVLKALSVFESTFEKAYGVSLNEAMILCALLESKKEMTSTSVSKRTELSPSHTSKMLRILEEKQLIERTLSNGDKRLMFFHLSKTGSKKVKELNINKVEIPEILKPLFENYE